MGNQIQSILTKNLLGSGPLDGSARGALAGAAQMTSGLKNVSDGAFFEIYKNLLETDAFSKIFSNNFSDNQDEDSSLGFGSSSISDLMASIPSIAKPQNLEISHVEIDGDTGKIIFKDGSSTAVPVTVKK